MPLLRKSTRRDRSRYALTPLAQALLEDPLETWLLLDKDAAANLDHEDEYVAPVLRAVANG
jgi:hypothetical protein